MLPLGTPRALIPCKHSGTSKRSCLHPKQHAQGAPLVRNAFNDAAIQVSGLLLCNGHLRPLNDFQKAEFFNSIGPLCKVSFEQNRPFCSNSGAMGFSPCFKRAGAGSYHAQSVLLRSGIKLFAFMVNGVADHSHARHSNASCGSKGK